MSLVSYIVIWFYSLDITLDSQIVLSGEQNLSLIRASSSFSQISTFLFGIVTTETANKQKLDYLPTVNKYNN